MLKTLSLALAIAGATSIPAAAQQEEDLIIIGLDIGEPWSVISAIRELEGLGYSLAWEQGVLPRFLEGDGEAVTLCSIIGASSEWTEDPTVTGHAVGCLRVDRDAAAELAKGEEGFDENAFMRFYAEFSDQRAKR